MLKNLIHVSATTGAMGFLALTLSVAPADAQQKGGKPPSSINVVASFANGEIGDDGQGPYYHNEAGNRCQIEPGPGDFMFQLDAYRFNGVRREAYVDLHDPADESSVPQGFHQSSSFFFTADELYQMSLGEVKLTTGAARFRDSNDGKLYWLLFSPYHSQGTGELLKVTRLTDTTRMIEAEPGSVAELATMDNRGRYTHIGNYHVSFSVTVSQE
jgi:hypothetical protein